MNRLKMKLFERLRLFSGFRFCAKYFVHLRINRQLVPFYVVRFQPSGYVPVLLMHLRTLHIGGAARIWTGVKRAQLERVSCLLA